MSGLFGGKPDNSAAMAQIEAQRKETEAAKKAAMDERRTLKEEMAAKRMARRGGGSRMLLSSARLTPETGIEEDDKITTTLG